MGSKILVRHQQSENDLTTAEVPKHVLLNNLLRLMCFCYVVLIACPIRFWPIENSVDGTWVFACNYAAAHGLMFGKDIAWTYGPLGYLTFPEDIGNNLICGLSFQLGLWIVIILVLRLVFWSSGIYIANLLLYSCLWALSAPLYWVGVENLVLVVALVLLVLFRRQGGRGKLISALILIGILPLLKMTSALIGGGALLGFAIDYGVRLRAKAWSLILTVIAIPATVVTGYFAIFSSFDALVTFFRFSANLSAGYSQGMSSSGDPTDFVWAALALLFLVVAYFVLVPADQGVRAFFALFLAIPIYVSFKHGFIRQDMHIINFFCFIALAAALLSLANGGRKSWSCWLVAALSCLPFGVLCQNKESYLREVSINEMLGLRQAHRLLILRSGLGVLREQLGHQTNVSLSSSKLEPNIRTAIGNSTVASLSLVFTPLVLDNLNLTLYPVVQRYQANTPSLDKLNAEWIEYKGPRYLLFDGSSIDERQPWAETPAMWLQVYRWYDTLIESKRNLLLIRRSSPRFSKLSKIQGESRTITRGFELHPSAQPAMLWSMNCPLTTKGSLLNAVLRVPRVTMSIYSPKAQIISSRVIMPLLSTPVLGPLLPTTLPEFARLFSGQGPWNPVDQISFGGEGRSFYSPACTVDFWQAMP